MQEVQLDSASFRDPSGFIFSFENAIYRQVNQSYREEFDLLHESGLYDQLVAQELLVAHQEVSLDLASTQQAYKIIKPEHIPYISYPYEWSFSQLKDAALLTLKIQKMALAKELSLKDASAYNIQFLKGKPVFIDTLSFEKYKDGPWVAYKQFCQHFLAPLALKVYCDRRMAQLLRTNIDGIPLDLASKLLPRRSWLNFSLMAHLHLHAKMQSKYSDAAREETKTSTKLSMNKSKLVAMIDQLESCVKRLKWSQEKTEWGDYYADTNYQDESMSHKRELVATYLQKVDAAHGLRVIDMGANNGEFSRIAANYAEVVVSQDIDEVAVEKNYLFSQHQKETKILPLLQDLVNPSPAIGWANQERMSLCERGGVDVVMALALIHHIAISNNVPLSHIAHFFARMGRNLVIEFVPKEDSQVERLLATREDIFPNYTQAGFEAAFAEYFNVQESTPVKGTKRTLYLMTVKS